MTISSTTNKFVYTGNGSTTVFAFTFKVFSASDLQVYLSNGITDSLQTITTNYTVSLNANQNTSPGGTVTMLTAPASGFKLILIRNISSTQETDLINGGAFYADTVENALDKTTMLIQQLEEHDTRTVVLPLSASGIDGTLPLPSGGKAIVWKEDLTGFRNTNYSIDEVQANCQTYASLAAASQADAAASAASAATLYDQFDDRFLGAKATDPTLDNDGNAILTGALYWNTTSQKMRAWSGTQWQDTAVATPASYTTQTFSGTGSQTAFTMSGTPAGLSSLMVYVGGSRRYPTIDYTYSGTTLTFTTAPASGTNNIFVLWATAVAVGVPDDLSISTQKIQNSAVTAPKIVDSIVNDLTSATAAQNDYVFAASTANSGAKRKILVSEIVAFAVAFPSGTRLAFQQTSAPTGWTKDTTAALDDSIMRIVTGTVSSGGSTAFSTFNAQTATGGTTLATTQIPSHTHGSVISSSTSNSASGANITTGTSKSSVYVSGSTGGSGGGGSHSHSMTASIKYNDFIIASKN